MKKKAFQKSGFLLALSSTLILGCTSHGAIQQLLDKRVALANGIDFDTAKLVAVNPETGDEIPACIPVGPTKETSKKPTTQTDQVPQCEVELILDEKNPALRTALELSKNPISGEIKKNGDIKPARFVVTVTTLYQGSTCNVVYSGGEQIENCTTTPRRPGR
ncbi:hypothetical protein [Methylomonas sp. DH-1]|uniref:hypothetical protein n=1 Tax=Methylomonas sp. (strain DH-1) TaxID=1727196 RepID=UPI000A79E7C3|nr:hypothetical protein [Methylomonas sp. DH-1]